MFELQLLNADTMTLQYTLPDTSENRVLINRLADAEEKAEKLDCVELDLFHIVEGVLGDIEVQKDILIKTQSKIESGIVVPQDEIFDLLDKVTSKLAEAEIWADEKIKEYESK